jgi:hypothetical protein
VLKKVTLSQNKLFGAFSNGHHTIDADQSGWAALCDALPSSPVEELNVADVGMGVKGVTSLAKAMSALARVDIRDADVEEAVLETLRAAAPAGCEVVWE